MNRTSFCRHPAGRCHGLARFLRWADATRLLVAASATLTAFAGDFGIAAFDSTGRIAWTNACVSGVCTVEIAPLPGGKAAPSWQAESNYFTTSATGQAQVPVGASNVLVRLLAVDVSAGTAQGYTNLLQSYGTLTTIAGSGFGALDNVNYWDPGYEGGYATSAALSRPHFAMADAAGNVFIVDKCSDSVLKVTPDGRIHTVAGTHADGFNGDGPAAATSLALSQPNGLYVQADGTFYVLDTGNGRVRRVDTNGVMSTLFAVPGGTSVGRGLWVDATESRVLFCDGTQFEEWTPASGVSVLNSKFNDLGNLIVNTAGDAIVTDRGAGKVYRVDIRGKNQGDRTLLYGDGKNNPVVDGTSAATGSLNGVRGVWELPTGGYLLALHEGSQLLYVDPANVVHVFVDGQAGVHAGDGLWFHSPGPKLSELRSVSMDNHGNILIVESDAGLVRRIQFQRLNP
jgi:hypothetical protein